MQKRFPLILILCLIFVGKSDIHRLCSDKAIIDENAVLKYNGDSDKTLAYNGPASCATLEVDDGYFCCYAKIKFKNQELDEKFTHKGCVVITEEHSKLVAQDDFDNLVDTLKNKFDDNNANITYKKFSIDCSSKYLSLFGIALILLFL